MSTCILVLTDYSSSHQLQDAQQQFCEPWEDCTLFIVLDILTGAITAGPIAYEQGAGSGAVIQFPGAQLLDVCMQCVAKQTLEVMSHWRGVVVFCVEALKPGILRYILL